MTTPAETTGVGAVYGSIGRGAAGALFAFSRACLPLLLFVVWKANDPPVTPPVLLALFGAFIALPAVVLWGCQYIARSTWSVNSERLVFRGRFTLVEIPPDAVAAVRPWRLPWPTAGLTLRTHSGRRFAVEDPRAELFDALRATEMPAARSIRDTTLTVYARARRAAPRRRWYHRLGKFPIFGLLPTAPLFNVHQYIAYGGTFGQYYLLGLRAYVTTFAFYWSGVTIYLLLFASVIRALAETAALATAHFHPERAVAARAFSERAATVLYYAGVPVLLALRFWP